MRFENDDNEKIGIHELDAAHAHIIYDVRPTDMTFIWNVGKAMDITIDKVRYELTQNQVIFLTEFHQIDSVGLEAARMVRFNQPFYCIVNHDNEVGSKGFLFFGASGVPVITVDEHMLRAFEVSWEMFCAEMASSDILKRDMLQCILKRMLILSARILRRSSNFHKLEAGQSDIVREFNYLVEKHFAEHHDVAFYASKLNKSPKTISNLFSVFSSRGPQNIIHDRIMLHARRLIGYTSMSIKEIAHELGYDDTQTFSRFFKNREGISPMQYREKLLFQNGIKGKIDNNSGIAA